METIPLHRKRGTKKVPKKKKHALSITGGVWLIASYDTYKFCKQ